MNPETRTLISWWMIRARDETDPFVKMFILFMCLDAWITSGSGSDSDTKKLIWLKTTANPLRQYWPTTPNKTAALNGLQNVGKVEDMRPNHRGEYKQLDDVNDFDAVIDFIYQIRCNLFHGGKSYVNTNDRQLCHWSAKILHQWLEWTLAKDGSS